MKNKREKWDEFRAMGFEERADFPIYNDVIEGKNKKYSADLVYMDPENYLETAQQGFIQRAKRNNPNVNLDEIMPRDMFENKDYVKKAAEEYAIEMETGATFPTPSLEYDSDGMFMGQEGRHRALAMKQRNKKEMPVYVIKKKRGFY